MVINSNYQFGCEIIYANQVNLRDLRRTRRIQSQPGTTRRFLYWPLKCQAETNRSALKQSRAADLLWIWTIQCVSTWELQVPRVQPQSNTLERPPNSPPREDLLFLWRLGCSVRRVIFESSSATRNQSHFQLPISHHLIRFNRSSTFGRGRTVRWGALGLDSVEMSNQSKFNRSDQKSMIAIKFGGGHDFGGWA